MKTEVEELTFFDENYQIVSHAKASDPATSFHAAKVAVKNMSKNMALVMEVFDEVAPGGLIAEELEPLAQAKGMRPGNASKRISDLASRGKLVWRGGYKNTTSGCKARIWHKA